jgi:hypothetical protein
MADFTEGGKGAGARRQIVEIIAVDALNPEPIAFRVPRVAHAHRHIGFPEP